MNRRRGLPSPEIAANCAAVRGEPGAGCRASGSIAALVCALGLVACTRAAAPSVVVSKNSAAEALVRTTDDLSPGDLVHIWRRPCRTLRHCAYRQVARGVVTAVVLDASGYALVEVAPGDDVAVGDRAVKDSPMFYWHPDPPLD